MSRRIVQRGTNVNRHPNARGQAKPRRTTGGKSRIPREFLPLLHAFAFKGQERIELWCYALVLLMIDEEQVRFIGTHTQAGRQWATVRIVGGEEFDVVKPDLSEEQEQNLLDGVRHIVRTARARRQRLN